ncbi:hypothetical protein [Natronococcus sp.]|uniref:hypothetical protein n=1 Tax=Natronococcus sp. TaxID=35747 RepID=UPI003A4E1BBA
MSESPLRRGYRTLRRDGLRWLSIRGLGYAVFGREACPETLRWRLGHRYYRRALTFDTDEYAAPLDPFEIAYVDPSRITHTTMREYPPWGSKERLFGSVRDGDWDRPDPNAKLPYEFCERPIYQIFHARFEEGKAWEEIDGIQRRLRSVENGKSTWRNCTSREDVFRRCAYCDALYESLRTEGCRTQRELGPRDREPGFMPAMGEEILVDVGRNGELLHVGGMHRLAIAKLLGLSEIPVAFLVRHAEWMEYRDRVYERGRASDHPDLESLVE